MNSSLAAVLLAGVAASGVSGLSGTASPSASAPGGLPVCGTSTHGTQATDSSGVRHACLESVLYEWVDTGADPTRDPNEFSRPVCGTSTHDSTWVGRDKHMWVCLDAVTYEWVPVD